MVISTVNQVVYNGDGITTAWPFTFRIIDATDIKLLLIDADGTETDVSADYYVDMVNNTVYYPGYAPGAEPPEEDQPPKVQTGQKLVVYRELPITQEADLGDKWPFKVIENGLDKLTMILQQIFDWWGRTLKISQGGSVDGFDTNVYPEAGKVIAVNEDGDGFEAREALMEVNGAWDGETRQIKGVAEPTDNQDVTTKNYVDTLTDGNFMKLQDGGNAWEGRNVPIRNVAGPVQVNDVATKDYVDSILNGFVLAGDSRTVPFDNVAQMIASDIEVGQIAFTLGYHDINDGGAGVYSIRGKVAGETEDGNYIIFLENGNVAELISQNDSFPYKKVDYSETLTRQIFKSFHQAKLEFEEQKIIDENEGTLTVATFNVYTGTSKRVIGSLTYLPIFKQLATILMLKAQVIGFEEINYEPTVFNSPDIYSVENTYSDNIFGSNGVLQDYDYGNLMESTYTAVSKRTGQYTEVADRERRGWANMVISVGGKTVSIYCTHLDTDDTVSLDQLSQLLSVLNADNAPYKIIVGDFNMYGAANYTTLTENGYKAVTSFDGNAIDHIFVTENITALEVGVIRVAGIPQVPSLNNGDYSDVAVSDHNPRWARLQFN